MSRKKLLEILPKVKRVSAYVRLNYYTEFLVDLPLSIVEQIRARLDNKSSPASRESARFSATFDEATGHLSF